MYEKNPRSRVFAPLAETYRKLGMVNEGMKILQDGIKHHPSYTLGYIVLAHCYFDQNNFEMAYNSLRPFTSQNLENITMQKLYAKSCVQLGHLNEALQTYKYLLFMNPRNPEVAAQIKMLEDDLLVDKDIQEITSVVTNNDSSFDEDDWVQVDFNLEEKDERRKNIEARLEDWGMDKTSPLEAFKNQLTGDAISITEHNLDDEYYHEDYDNESVEVIETIADDGEDLSQPLDNSVQPIITHTLVDLYFNQGHFDKAASILENILELHPEDQATKERLDEIALLMVQGVMKEVILEKEIDEDHLKVEKLEEIFNLFNDKIKSISVEKLSST